MRRQQLLQNLHAEHGTLHLLKSMYSGFLDTVFSLISALGFGPVVLTCSVFVADAKAELFRRDPGGSATGTTIGTHGCSVILSV